ncbi:predicted protein [Naegleria gruberi]|uniref:Predicted protein n=1 Tax=Naegleria gruberi TaxID=5762 RepID=D2VCW6_NAEGR|nr:uncharacterized protein NAEGRDRAFT_48523 [Naegleria gruberi]EFC45376.1 predicted protein [Naegleria gruberi]|eukprot:XP_002678120.1 predicted protein [Naegleria gruberi strain NEG-M]
MMRNMKTLLKPSSSLACITRQPQQFATKLFNNSSNIRNFSLSRISKQQQQSEQNSGGSSESSGKRQSPFRRLLKTSLLLSLGISTVAIVWSVRQYNQEPNDSVLDKVFKNLYGPYRNYVQLTTPQPNIEETLVYNNDMLSFDASNSADPTDPLSNLFVKPGLLIKEEIHNVGGTFEVFDDYGHTLDLIWMLMSRDEFNKASNSVDSGSREELLNGEDFELLEFSINRGLNPEEEIVYMERINPKVSSLFL